MVENRYERNVSRPLIVDSKLKQLGHDQRDESLGKSEMGLLLYRYDDDDDDDEVEEEEDDGKDLVRLGI